MKKPKISKKPVLKQRYSSHWPSSGHTYSSQPFSAGAKKGEEYILWITRTHPPAPSLRAQRREEYILWITRTHPPGPLLQDHTYSSPQPPSLLTQRRGGVHSLDHTYSSPGPLLQDHTYSSPQPPSLLTQRRGRIYFGSHVLIPGFSAGAKKGEENSGKRYFWSTLFIFAVLHS